MKKTGEVRFISDSLQDIHYHLVLIDSDVGIRKDAGKLKLSWSYFVVFCLGKDTEFPQFFIDVFHEGSDPGRDGTEVMIIEFLTLWRGMTEKRSAGQDQI